MDAAWMGATLGVAVAVAVSSLIALVVIGALGRRAHDRGERHVESVLRGVGTALVFIALAALVVAIGLVLFLAFGTAVGLAASVWPW